MSRQTAIDLGTAWVEEAQRVLAAAFASDPTIRWVCDAEREGFERRLQALYGALVRLQVGSGEPRLGVVDGGRLVAVCHLLRPASRIPRLAEARLALRLAWRLGPRALARGARFARAEARCRPATPHYYLVSIGVDPSSQGRGHGGTLLRAVHARAEGDTACAGVALDTQKPRNVGLYQRFGYRVTREEDVGHIHSWCMFRPNAGRP